MVNDMVIILTLVLILGIQCNTCKNGTYGLENVKSSGCTSCGCNRYGSSSINCHSTSGQCTCWGKSKNQHCVSKLGVGG